MNWLDAIIVIPLLWGIYKGWKHGFIFEIAMLIGLILGLYLAFKFNGLVSSLLGDKMNENTRLFHWLSFFIIVAVVILILFFLAKFLEEILKITGLNLFNKIAGALLGLLKFGLVISIILWLLRGLEPDVVLIKDDVKQKSFFYPYVLKVATWINPALKEIKEEFKENIGSK